MTKICEVLKELQLVMSGRNGFIDTILPAILYLILFPLVDFLWALILSSLVAILFLAWRLIGKMNAIYALGGFAGILLTAAITWLGGSAKYYYLQDIVIGGLIALAVVVSAILGRPLVALTSRLVRRWPPAWYQHPRVAPAYREVNLFWAFFFSIKTVLQGIIFIRDDPTLIAVSNILGGWPATVVLLVISYLYGSWRLKTLHGPGVEELISQKEPPWQGQASGF